MNLWKNEVFRKKHLLDFFEADHISHFMDGILDDYHKKESHDDKENKEHFQEIQNAAHDIHYPCTLKRITQEGEDKEEETNQQKILAPKSKIVNKFGSFAPLRKN